MPQDELWRASARITGWSCRYVLDTIDEGKDQMWFAPTWSKHPPSSRDGGVVVALDPCFRDYAHRLVRAAQFETLGGSAKHVPSVVRHELRQIQASFQEGALQ